LENCSLYQYIELLSLCGGALSGRLARHILPREHTAAPPVVRMPRTTNAPQRSEGDDAIAATPAPAPEAEPHHNNGPSGEAGNSGETLIKKETEAEETLGQLRDRLGLGASGSARVPAPGPRAPFVHIKVEDSRTSGDDTDVEGGGGGGEKAMAGEGDGEGEEEEAEMDDEKGQQREQHAHAPGASSEGRMEAGADAVLPARRARLPPGSYADTAVELDTDDDYEEEEEEKEEEEEDAEPREQRAHVPGGSLMGSSEAVRLQSLTPGAHSLPESPRVRLPLRVPGRVADNAVQDNDIPQPEEEEAEASFAPVLMMRGGGGPAGTSRFTGVAWHKSTSKWLAKCKGNYLGLYTTEEAAACAYSKYLEDGSVPRRTAASSQFKGVCWNKSNRKWN
jgi:hypothetical protein